MPSYFPLVSTRSINKIAHTPGIGTMTIPAFGSATGTQEHSYNGGYLLSSLDPTYLANSGNITTSEVKLFVNLPFASLGINHPEGLTNKGSSLASRLLQIHFALANETFTYSGTTYSKGFNTIGNPKQDVFDMVTTFGYMGYGSLAGGFQRNSSALGPDQYTSTEHVQSKGINTKTDWVLFGNNITYQQQRTFQIKNNNLNPISMGLTEMNNTN